MKEEEADLLEPSGFGPAACSHPGQDGADESGDIPSRLLSVMGQGFGHLLTVSAEGPLLKPGLCFPKDPSATYCHLKDYKQ